MGMWYNRLRTLTAVAAGTGSGVATYLFAQSEDVRFIKNSATITSSECAKWDDNWDLRDPKTLVQPMKDNSPEEQNMYNQNLDASTPKVTRYIILVRHGQFLSRGDSDLGHHLTDIGRSQAKFTGKRLKALNIKWDRIVASTQTRAQETAKIITAVLNYKSMENCDLIREGEPIRPEPPRGSWKPDEMYLRDGPRIEDAFRKYFYRADPKEPKDTYTLLVGHSNVIRYFVCRALQFPPEAWLRLSLKHGSITWISIPPSGRVILRSLGDSGHIPPELVTHRNCSF